MEVFNLKEMIRFRDSNYFIRNNAFKVILIFEIVNKVKLNKISLIFKNLYFQLIKKRSKSKVERIKRLLIF